MLKRPSRTAGKGTSFFFATKILILYCDRTAVALRGKDGVVFAVEKLVTSKLYETGANRRIFNIDTHIGMVKS